MMSKYYCVHQLQILKKWLLLETIKLFHSKKIIEYKFLLPFKNKFHQIYKDRRHNNTDAYEKSHSASFVLMNESQSCSTTAERIKYIAV